MAQADSPTKTCTTPGCTRPLRARGLCSTHYNRAHQPGRHSLEAKACEVCGAQVMRTPGQRYRTVCSTRCRNVLVWGRPVGTTGTTWEDWAGSRARRAGATVVHHVTRAAVGERDGWQCRACMAPVDLDADPLAPCAPTVDHIVPLSKAGQHTMENVQLLCYSCNSKKGNRLELASA